MDAEVMGWVLHHLKTCNKDNHDLHMLTILATPSGVTYTIMCESEKQPLIQSEDLKEVAIFLKQYVSWEEPWDVSKN